MPFLLPALVGLGLVAAPARGAEGLPVYRETIRIEITRHSTPATAKATHVVAINEAIAEVFQDRAVVFDLTEHLDAARLVCTATGESLAVGVDLQSPVFLERTYHKLKKDEPGKITFCVANPQSLKPGVYRGSLWTVAHDENQNEDLPRSLKLTWDIVLVVHGRRLVSVDFQRTKAGKPLRVGAPASLVVTVETVGCDLGQGTLTLDWWSTKEKPQPALRIKVPLEQPLDPLVHLQQDSESACHSQWRDCPLWTQVRKVAPDERSAPADKLQQTYEIEVVAPPCFLPGTMQAEATWQQAEAAADSTAQKASTAEEPVLPGILVFPQPAFVNEPVTVIVRGEEDLGATPHLLANGPSNYLDLELTRRRAVPEGAPERLYDYVGRLHPPEAGSYQIGARESGGAAPQCLEEPAVFQVCFGAEKSLTGPIEVYASAPPFWVADSVGWKAFVPGASRFWYDRRFLRSAELHNLNTFRGLLQGNLTAHDPQTEPLIRFSVGQGSAAQPKAEPSDAEGQAQPDDAKAAVPEATATQWPLAADREKSPMLDLSVDLVRESAPHRRHRTGRYNYVQRMMIRGEDTRGSPVVRIVNIPFSVIVSTDWQYYRWLIGICVALVAGGLICWRVVRNALWPPSGKGKGKKEVQPPQPPPEPNGPDDFFSGTSSRQASEQPAGQPRPSATPGAPAPAPSSAKPASPAPRPTQAEPRAPGDFWSQ